MRITYVSSSEVPSRDANSIQVMRMCQAFVHNGHQVSLLAVRGFSEKRSEDDYTYYGVEPCFEIVKCPHPQIRWVGSALHALCVMGVVVLRPRPDLFYARYAYNLAVLSILRVPMILEVHDISYRSQVQTVLRRLFRQAHFVRLVAISKSLAAEYRCVFPELPSNKVVVAHDGADVPQITSYVVPSDWPGRSGALQVGYTGHLYPGKGVEVIIALADILPDVDFHIVGGTDEDILRWKRKDSMDNLFFHGYIAPSKVAQYCVNFDVLLAPYQERVSVAGGKGDIAKWMSPLKIFEYMALGKPIICSDLPVLREVLVNQVNALLVPHANVEAWAQALILLRKNMDLRERLGNAAKEDFFTHYTWKKRAIKVLPV